jgi:hypothetical protein
MKTWLLPYPSQLPQDYYNKNLPTYVAPIPPTPTPTPTSPVSAEAVNSGGVYYGPTPPSNPSYGWFWTQGHGQLFMYVEPGIWTQISTNWYLPHV